MLEISSWPWDRALCFQCWNPWRWQWSDQGHGVFEKILNLKHNLACVFQTVHLGFHSLLISTILINNKIKVFSVSEFLLCFSSKLFLKVLLISFGGTSTAYVHWRQKLEELWPVWERQKPMGEPLKTAGAVSAVFCQLCGTVWTHLCPWVVGP